MKNLSLKLDDAVYEEAEEVLGLIDMPRNRFINEAVAHYARLKKREWLAAELKRESALASADSMRILKEFDALNDAP